MNIDKDMDVNVNKKGVIPSWTEFYSLTACVYQALIINMLLNIKYDTGQTISHCLTKN